MSTWGAQSNVQSAHKELTYDPQIEQWKVRRLIRQLEAAKGAGTSMISLLIPPKYDISRASKMLTEEYGTAAGIKSHQNRISVLAALTSTQQRLKLYSKTPENGLIIYCGEATTEEGKAKRLTIDFEPFKPIHKSMYWCDSKFHTEDLAELLESDEKFGFLIIDGNGALYGTLAGNHREVLHRFSVELPKKHGRGGQSALRFARLRLEKRHNYLRKVSEIASQIFITDARPNVSGLIVAGSADFKTDLTRSDLWDKRLDAVMMRPLLDVAYGGENGFNQAIELSADTLRNVKFVLEKQLLSRFFSEVAQDSGRYCFGLQETLRALEMGAVETLILWENLEARRLLLRSTRCAGDPEQEEVLLLSPGQAQEVCLRRRRDAERGAEAEGEVAENVPFIEWAVDRHRSFGARLEFVTDRSQEGSQFCKGFGGVGGLLRYRVELEASEEPGLAEESDEDFM